MSDVDQARNELELRGSSDNLVLAAEQLLALEHQKRLAGVTTEGFRELGQLIEHAAQDVVQLAAQERQRADGLANAVEVAHIQVEAIVAEPPLERILDRWRSAERRLASSTPGTKEAQVAAREVAALRGEYRERYEEISAQRARDHE
jgi:hypothetical protein